VSGHPNDDEHDRKVDAAWRQRFDEEPPASLDASIRAAARREAATNAMQGRRPPRAWRSEWVPLAAAAGVAVVAFGLLRWLPVDERPTIELQRGSIEESDVASGAQPAGTAPEPAAVSKRAAPPVERRERTMIPSSADSSIAERAGASHERRDTPAAPPPVTAPAPAPEPVQQSVPAEVAAPDDSAEVSVTGTRAKAAQRAGETDSTRARVQRIVELHAAGRLEEAAAALRELRAIEPHADQQLPAELRPWAATVMLPD
jgi:hypothetical protein